MIDNFGIDDGYQLQKVLHEMEEKQNKKYISQNVYGWGSNNLG